MVAPFLFKKINMNLSFRFKLILQLLVGITPIAILFIELIFKGETDYISFYLAHIIFAIALLLMICSKVFNYFKGPTLLQNVFFIAGLPITSISVALWGANWIFTNINLIT